MIKLSQPNISDAAIEAVVDVLKSGNLVQGVQCEAFEYELAEYLGCSDVVLASSGTAALHLALLSLGIGPGDAVIVPDFTFPATANVVKITGATSVIVDVDRDTYTLSIENLESVIRDWNGPDQLKAIMPVHEFGCPVQMDEVNRLAKEHSLFVVEDAACALGATYKGTKVGTLGDIGCFSFHPRKTLTTGEGGALATNSPSLAKRLRRLRSHGMERTGSQVQFIEPGLNYRMTDFQAVLGRHQLPDLDKWIKDRAALVEVYRSELSALEQRGIIKLPARVEGHSWQTLMITLDAEVNRDELIKSMRGKGTEVNLGAQSLSSIGIYSDSKFKCKNGSYLYQSGLALPLYENLDRSGVNTISGSLIKCLK
ncbi:DegT/DnrJ/EryC1/StrS aminotransferase family protein [Motiliproteus sp. SC1-56]|uniref:DegT/DnrJ/EryC1/StrS family aminotransferase n=1 Tax=Motiliproteus sp. SC1-56 TaxID=2799565 RepID=UPI001A9040DA